MQHGYLGNVLTLQCSVPFELINVRKEEIPVYMRRTNIATSKVPVPVYLCMVA